MGVLPNNGDSACCHCFSELRCFQAELIAKAHLQRTHEFLSNRKLPNSLFEVFYSPVNNKTKTRSFAYKDIHRLKK